MPRRGFHSQPELVDLQEGVLEAPLGVDHDVGRREPLGIRRLGPDATDRLVARHPTQLDEPRDAGLVARVHDDHEVEIEAGSRLDEKRHVVDDDRALVEAGRRIDAFAGEATHLGVRDAVEHGEFLAVGEHDLRETGSIEIPRRCDDLRPECRRDLGEGGCAPFDDPSSELVGVDVHSPEFGQPAGDDRLARGDPAGEPDEVHANMVTVGPARRTAAVASTHPSTRGWITMLEFLTGLGLASAAGLNAYIPLLALGLAGRFTDLVTLPANWAWLENEWVLGIVAALLVIEFVADKVPAVDTVNDWIQTIVRPTSGGLVFGSGSTSETVAVTDPAAFFSSNQWVPIAIGVVVALVVHLGKMSARPVMNLVTAGVAAPVASAVEDAASVVLAVAAVVLPVVIAILVPALIVGAFVMVRRMRRRRDLGVAVGSPRPGVT